MNNSKLTKKNKTVKKNLSKEPTLKETLVKKIQFIYSIKNIPLSEDKIDDLNNSNEEDLTQLLTLLIDIHNIQEEVLDAYIQQEEKIAKEAKEAKEAIQQISNTTNETSSALAEATKSTLTLFSKNETNLFRVEFFDERFYKIPNLHKDYYAHYSKLYPNFTFLQNDFCVVFAPSVTTILGNTENNYYLARWRGDIGNELADEITDTAKYKGSLIHMLCEHLQRGGIVIYKNTKRNEPTDEQIKQIEEIALKNNTSVKLCYSQDVQVQVARLKYLLNALKPEIVSTELSVVNLNDEFLFGGTLDSLWRFHEDCNFAGTLFKKDCIYAIDFKTGKSITESYFTQLSAYTEAVEHQCNIAIEGAVVVHLNASNKRGIEGVKLALKNRKELSTYYEYFKHVYKAYMFNNADVKPALYEIPIILSTDENIINKILEQGF